MKTSKHLDTASRLQREHIATKEFAKARARSPGHRGDAPQNYAASNFVALSIFSIVATGLWPVLTNARRPADANGP